MARMFSVQNTHRDQERNDYSRDLFLMKPTELIKEFLSYLDYIEETDSGRAFHPIEISSCRVLMNEPLAMVIGQMKELAKEVE